MRRVIAGSAIAALTLGCSATRTPPPTSYCEVARAIATSSVDVHATGGTGAQDLRNQLEDAQAELVRLRALLQRWPGLAGAEVRPDVTIVAAERLQFLDVLEERAPLMSLKPPDAAANQRVVAYTQQRCGFALSPAPDRAAPPSRPGAPPPPPP